jgi:hypothetical protein
MRTTWKTDYTDIWGKKNAYSERLYRLETSKYNVVRDEYKKSFLKSPNFIHFKVN